MTAAKKPTGSPKPTVGRIVHYRLANIDGDGRRKRYIPLIITQVIDAKRVSGVILSAVLDGSEGLMDHVDVREDVPQGCLLYTSPSPRDS